MLLRLFRLPRELVQALWRTLLVEREAAGAPAPPVHLVLPDAPPLSGPFDRTESTGPERLFAELLGILREHGGFRTAEELAAAARRRGREGVSAAAVRDALKLHGARHLEVRLRASEWSSRAIGAGRVAEFRARPAAAA